MGLVDDSDAVENWSPYVNPNPAWMGGLPDGEHEVNGYKFVKEGLIVTHKGSILFAGRYYAIGVEGMDKGSMLRDVSAWVTNWRSRLDDRQRKEVLWAEKYAAEFAHGTVGHNQLMVIAALAKILDEIEKVVGS